MLMQQKPGIAAYVHGHEIALYRFGGKIYATDQRCPHQGGNLCEGEVGDIEDLVKGRQSYVTCPVHKMRFNISTGEVLEGNCPPLQTYDVRLRPVDDGRVLVEVGF